MSYGKFHLVNLKQLLKVGKATTSALNPEPAFSLGFAFKEERFKDYSKVEIVTKTKLHHLPEKGHHQMFPPESSPPKKDPTLANYVALPLAQRLCVFPTKLALQCCSQIFTEMRINFQVVSKLNSLYFKNHQNFVLGLHSGSPSTLRLLLQSELVSSCGSVFREPMDPNLRTPASTWIDPPGKRVKVKIGSDVGTSLDFLDVRISGLWVDTPDPFARFCLQMPQSEI